MVTSMGKSVPVSVVPNPFWSTRARDEQRMRPEDLPVVAATLEESADPKRKRSLDRKRKRKWKKKKEGRNRERRSYS